MPAASASRTASFTRRIRSVIWAQYFLVRVDELVLLAVQVPNRLLEELLDFVVLARHAGNGQPGSLPELVVVDLRDRDTEAVLELRFCGLDELALPLQRRGLREMKLHREDAHVAGAHGPRLG